MIEIDNDDDVFIQMMNASKLIQSSVYKKFDELIIEFLKKIVSNLFPFGSPVLKYYRMKGIKFDYAI